MSPIEQSIKDKIERIGTPLKDWNIQINYGIKTGCNEAFIITEVKRNEILGNCKNEAERKRTDELIRPILRGRDIKRYGYNFAGWYLITAHNGIPEKDIPRIDIDDYPAVKAHLDKYWDKISVRADQGDTPYNLRSCAYMDDFSKPYIAYREISTFMDACQIPPGYLITNKSYIITGDNLDFLLVFFNSNLFNNILLKFANTTGGKGADFLGNIRLLYPDEKIKQKIKKILKIDDIDVRTNESDHLFFDIYNFTSLERDFIIKK